MDLGIITLCFDLNFENSPFRVSLRRTGSEVMTYVATSSNPIDAFKKIDVYYEMLKKLKGQHTHFIMTDMRDVIFQKDPRYMLMDTLNIYLEAKKIGDCPYSKYNIITRYGESVFNEMRHFPISCAGIVSGTYDGCMRYLRTMLEEFEVKRPFTQFNQGIHNYLLRKNMFGPLTIWDNEHSPVYTVGLMDELRVSKHVILNKLGDVPYMIHQYDRHITYV